MAEEKGNEAGNNRTNNHTGSNAGGNTGNGSSMYTSDLLNNLKAIAADLWREPPEDVPATPKAPQEKPAKNVLRRPDINIHNLWMTADETIDWTEALAHEEPSDGLTNVILWRFYHEKAEAVLKGDLKAYTEVLKRSNPLGELVALADGIHISVPDPDRAEATFTIRDEYMLRDGKQYLSAMGVRIARDLLACLPVSEVRVTARQQDETMMEVAYRLEQMLHRNFTFLDPVLFSEECGAVFSGIDAGN